MTRLLFSSLICVLTSSLALGCGNSSEASTAPSNTASPSAESSPESSGTPETRANSNSEEASNNANPNALPDALPNGLLLAYSQFQVQNGRVTANPGAARLELLTRRGGEWHTDVIEDSDSNVFHKAMVYEVPGQAPGILTLGGMGAFVKLWRRSNGAWSSETLWTRDFGGNFNRMRDAEIADLFGNQEPAIAVATHDQGVVSIIQPGDNGAWDVSEIDRESNTFIHEIEIGDLNQDGNLEVYATPSEPNNLDGGEQHGTVVRYVPRTNSGRTVVADLGNRHAKEIWVGDVDGDGRDELYVAVEALMTGSGANQRIEEPVEIRRYDHDTAPDAGVVIGRIRDRLCRFLTVGDLDGDGRKEMVVASFSSGLWLFRPGRDPRGEWSRESIDRQSSGFEHASIIADLDEDGRGELYVAADNQGELRRYVWQNGRPRREVIHSRPQARAMMTWNIMPFPASLAN